MVLPSQLYATAQLLEAQYPGITQRPKDFFRLVVPFVGANILTAGGTVTVNVTVSQDADFAWVSTSATFFANDHTTAVANPAVTINVVDTSSGRSLMSAADHILNFAGNSNGTGQQSQRLNEWPQVVMRGATLSTTLTNLDAGNQREIRVAFIGYKVYGSPLTQPGR